MSLFKRFVTVSTLLLIGAAFLPKAAQALTLIPPSLEFSVRPGQVVKQNLKLYNEGNAAVTVFASTSNFGANGEEGEPNFTFEEKPTGSAAWITFPTGPLTVTPGQRLEVPVTITVPNDAEPGGHYSSVFFGNDPSIKPKEGGQVSVRSLIGTLIILRVDGEVREQATIKEFYSAGWAKASDKTLTKMKSFNRLPATFTLRVENSGNVHLRPQGTITIKNLFGGESSTLSVNDINGAVLPNSIRKFDTQWHKVDGEGKPGSFFSELKNEWSNFAIGPYTATVSLSYGQSKRSLVATTTFSVWPWRLLTVSILLLALVIFLIVIGIKRYNQAIIERAQHTRPPTSLTGKK